MSSFLGIFKSPSRKKKPVPPVIPIPPPIPPSPEGPRDTILVDWNVTAIGMSYWNNINYHAGRNELKIFLSKDGEIIIYTIDKSTLQTIQKQNLGINHTGEGCYFSRSMHDVLYVPIGPELIQVNIYDSSRRVAWGLNDGNNLWQCHSSNDDRVHSASIKDSNYKIIFWGTNDPHNGTRYYDVRGIPDECQVCKRGKFLFIKEDSYNRIRNLENGSEVIIEDANGASGHSDCGFECAIGEDNHIGGMIYIDFNNPTAGRRIMYGPDIWNMGYVSFCNAKPGPIENQTCLITTPDDLRLAKLDGGAAWGQVITDNLTQSSDYEKRAKANLCPLGEYCIWTAYVDGQINAYIRRINL